MVSSFLFGSHSPLVLCRLVTCPNYSVQCHLLMWVTWSICYCSMALWLPDLFPGAPDLWLFSRSKFLNSSFNSMLRAKTAFFVDSLPHRGRYLFSWGFHKTREKTDPIRWAGSCVLKSHLMKLMSPMTRMFVDPKRERNKISLGISPWMMHKSFVILFLSPDANACIEVGLVFLINHLVLEKGERKWFRKDGDSYLY